MSALFQYLDEFGTYTRLFQNPNYLISHFIDLGSLYLCVMITFLTSLGWGQLFRRVTGLPSRNQYASTDVWMGILAISITTELINFFLPITWMISFGFAIIGLLAIINKPVTLQSFNYFLKHPLMKSISPIIIILAFVLGSKALYTPWSGDNYLYHLNTLRWLNEFPAIPGLGNLHGRLAFNQSYFSFLAPINFYPYLKHAPATGNLFFILLSLISILEILFTKIKFRLVIFIGLFIAIAKHADTLHSTNSNFIISLLQVVIFGQLITLFNSDDDDKLERICTTLYLCLLIFIFKFSSASFVAGSILIITYQFRKLIAQNVRVLTKAFTICSIILGIHMIRGYLLSGAPFYPSTFLHISSFPWSVAPNEIREEARWIMSWARMPGPKPEEVLGNWDWVIPWTLALPANFIAAILIGSFFYISALFTRSHNQDPKNNQLLYIPLVSSLIFWFLAAPAIGFVGNIPELFATLSTWLFCNTSKITQNLKERVMGQFAHVFLATILALFLIKAAGIKKISFEGWMPTTPAPLLNFQTISGLQIFIPANSDKCGDSPLPCSPYPNKNLQLIGDSIPSGFTTKNFK